ncbi:MAG: beta-lactamase family protein [Candidatus Eremiobacteraeota bacterium]|nr:beta-lactamase family protein [Candidatus Eremiobacteraeota bacterium]
MIGALLAAAAVAVPFQSIDGIVERVTSEQHVAALSLGVARDGVTIYLRGYGYREGKGRPDGFTIYPAGSIAKQFTAAVVLQDVAAGTLALDRGDPPLRALLDQTAGGTWTYNNENYATLGSILERADGVPFCRLLDARILVPLQLRSTSCGPPLRASNVAGGSTLGSAPIAPAAGGLWSNAPDLLRWLGDLRAGRVVSLPDVAEMTTSATLPGGVPANYGFGFFVANWYGYRVVYHDGFVPGYSAVDALSLDDGVAIAILCDADRIDLVPLAKSIFAMVDSPRDANLYASPSAPPENEDATVSAALRAILTSAAFERFGTLQSLEFLERTHSGALTYDRYRATFDRTVRTVTAGYGKDEAIESLTIAPPP